MRKVEYIVSDVLCEMKIRDYLSRRLGFSTSLIAKVKYGGVRLAGEVVHMRAMVKNGDVIEVTFPEESSENIQPIDIPLSIVYEDEHIIIINKPINMPTHPSRGNSLPTLANAVAAYLGGPFVFRSITRLDRDTSGLVLIAKDQLTAAKLSGDVRAGRIKKRYVAEVVGIPEPRVGVIDAPIERVSEGNIKRCVREDGKPSVTEYRVLSVNSMGNSLVSVTPITGRTHQIRVHMAYIGHPLVDDFLYGEKTPGKTYLLTCRELCFIHPHTGEEMNISI